MIKVVSILTRNAGMSHAEFRSVWLSEHAPMVRSVPEVKKYVLSFTVDGTVDEDEGSTPGIDGIAELWYASTEDLARAQARAEMQAVLANGALHLSSATSITTEEIDII